MGETMPRSRGIASISCAPHGTMRHIRNSVSEIWGSDSKSAETQHRTRCPASASSAATPSKNDFAISGPTMVIMCRSVLVVWSDSLQQAQHGGPVPCEAGIRFDDGVRCRYGFGRDVSNACTVRYRGDLDLACA